jgi:hypothetical protein
VDKSNRGGGGRGGVDQIGADGGDGNALASNVAYGDFDDPDDPMFYDPDDFGSFLPADEDGDGDDNGNASLGGGNGDASDAEMTNSTTMSPIDAAVAVAVAMEAAAAVTAATAEIAAATAAAAAAEKKSLLAEGSFVNGDGMNILHVDEWVHFAVTPATTSTLSKLRARVDDLILTR